jgi:tRNA 2-thiouridine synthesizing protein A
MSDIESDDRALRTADAELDTSGLVCPEPLMLVRNKVRDMASGQTLHVIATDPSTERDFANFCRFMRHEMIRNWQAGGKYRYLIRKGP